MTQGWGGKPGRLTRGMTQSVWRAARRCDTAGLRAGRAARVRTGPGRWRVRRDTNGCIVTGGAGLVSRYSEQQRCDTAACTQRHGREVPAIRPEGLRHGATLRTTQRAARALRHGAHAPRHGRCTPATRPRYGWGGGHDMTQRAPRHGVVRTTWEQRARNLGHGCVHCALDPILTQDTLFESLFMNTVHEVFQKIKNKIK